MMVSLVQAHLSTLTSHTQVTHNKTSLHASGGHTIAKAQESKRWTLPGPKWKMHCKYSLLCLDHAQHVCACPKRIPSQPLRLYPNKYRLYSYCYTVQPSWLQAPSSCYNQLKVVSAGQPIPWTMSSTKNATATKVVQTAMPVLEDLRKNGDVWMVETLAALLPRLDGDAWWDDEIHSNCPKKGWRKPSKKVFWSERTAIT